MAWVGWPPQANVSETTSWAWLSQLWECAREKSLMLGGDGHWPPAATSWGGGTITSLVDNGNHSWTITDATLGELPSGAVDDGKYWSGATRPPTICTSAKFWVGVQCDEGDDGGLRFLDGNYDLIIEDFAPGDWRDLKPWQVIRGRVTDNRNKSLTATIRLADHVTAGYLASTGSLVGKRFYLIRAGMLWWADKAFETGRFIDFPNDDEDWRGLLDSGKVYADGRGYLIETVNKLPKDPYNVDVEPVAWKVDHFKDKQLLALGGDFLRRLTLTGNAEQTAYFGGLTHVPTAAEEAGTGAFASAGPMTVAFTLEGSYSIVAPSYKAWPGRTGLPTRLWYTGVQEKYWSHKADDSLGVVDLMFAAASFHWFELEALGGGVECGDDASRVNVSDALDRDLVSSRTNMCSPAEEYFAPQFYKSLRGLQVYIESIVGGFTRPNYAGGSARPIAYSLAQCFADCASFESATSTITVERTTSVSGSTTTTNSTYFFVVSSAYRTWPVYFDALRPSGDRVAADRKTADATTGRIITGTAGTINATDLAAADLTHGLSGNVVYSPGWGPQQHPLELAHLYESTAFIPDIDPGSGPVPTPSVIYPPRVKDYCCLDADPPPDVCCKDCSGVGLWVHREPSLAGKTYDAYGLAIDGGGPAFAIGDVVLYAGDHHQDPGTNQQRLLDDDIVDLLYWDRLGEFKHPRDVQAALDAARKGKVTSSTESSVTDASKDWFANWYGGSVGKVHGGLAVAGTATTLTIAASFADTSGSDHCWFALERFVGAIFAAPFVTFCVEVDKTVGGVTTTHLLPITAVTNYAVDLGNLPVIHFDPQDGFTVAAGDVWRLPEPGTNLNRFRGRRVRVTTPAGVLLAELPITHSHRSTLFFALQTTAFPIDSVIEIIEHVPGPSFELVATPPTDGRPWQQLAEGKYWQQPLGDDPRGRPWHKDAREDLPHPSTKRFGKPLKGDYVYDRTYLQIYEMFNRLFDVLDESDLRTRAVASVPEANNVAVHAFFGQGWQTDASSRTTTPYGTTQPDYTFDATMGNMFAIFNNYFRGHGAFAPNEVGGIPFAGASYSSTGYFNAAEGGSVGQWDMGARQMYPTLHSQFQALIASDVTFYGYGAINVSNPDEGHTDTVSSDGMRVASTAFKFAPMGSGMQYRQWSPVSSVSVPSGVASNSVVGPKIGDINALTSPQGIGPQRPPVVTDTSNTPNTGQSSVTGYTGCYMLDRVAIRSFRAAARYKP